MSGHAGGVEIDGHVLTLVAGMASLVIDTNGAAPSACGRQPHPDPGSGGERAAKPPAAGVGRTTEPGYRDDQHLG